MVPWVEEAASSCQRCLTQVSASFWDVGTTISNCRVLSSPGKLWQSFPSRPRSHLGIVGKIGCQYTAVHTSNPCIVVVDFMRIRTHEKESSASFPLFPAFQLPLVVKCWPYNFPHSSRNQILFHYCRY